MDNTLYDILNEIIEGIVIVNEGLKICFWNDYMENVTGLKQEDVKENYIYEVLPNLNKRYFEQSIQQIIKNGCKIFFSAGMHRSLVSNKKEFNVKISLIQKNNSKFFLLEFIDVTNQFVRINQFKEYVQELYKLNQKLKVKEQLIKKLAYYDQLTGIANRTLFYKIAEKLIDNANRNNSLIGLLFLDIDKFKQINDVYGHEAGDKILKKVACILQNYTRKSDMVARFGGDEFIVLLPHFKDSKSYKKVASRIMNAEDKSIYYHSREIKISFSVGISLYPEHGNTIDTLILKADQAMYTAKNKGGNQYCIFE
ncbi:MAG: sensor domain-containing diguanylate cyclase [Epulopiscium sp.]|nr:sensor domain-containing diguanylate cyclase [Candidatus Epulonipiscium sp.]